MQCIMQPAGGCKTQALCKDSCAGVPSSDRQGHGPQHSSPVAYSLTRCHHTQLVGVCQVTQCVGCSEWVEPLAADEASPLPTLPAVHLNVSVVHTHARTHAYTATASWCVCLLKACRAALPRMGAGCWCRPPLEVPPFTSGPHALKHPYRAPTRDVHGRGDTDTGGRPGVSRCKGHSRLRTGAAAAAMSPGYSLQAN